MPAVMKLAAGASSRASRQTYGYHIDWDDPRAPGDVTVGRANRN
jgi:hypothetical protein